MHIVHDLIMRLVELIDHWGYPGIFILMLLESTVVPVPSELVMPPAGYNSALGHMSMIVAILVGTLGCVAGASINYAVAYFLGRPFFMKYGKYVLCPPHKFEKMEKFFIRHGEFGTFTGRLIFGVRHLISFPAGLAKMNFARFAGFTAAGSAIWCTVLTVIGWWIGKASAGKSEQELDALYTLWGKRAGYIAAAVCIVMIVVYSWRQKQKKATVN